jgi:prepilin-type N-terminal cleavage/methylation domain-containing protein
MRHATSQRVGTPDRPARPERSRGFTVVELLVVVVIILIVLTIATPAFRALIYSSQRSQATNSVNAAALAARELALRSASGDDAAVVFVHDRDGTMRIVPAVRVGSVLEPVTGGGGSTGGGAQSLGASPLVRRDVFAPVPQAAAYEMPTFWNVRGFAPARSMIEWVPGERPREEVAVWYNSPLYGGRDADDDAKLEGNWVFPETGFYNVESQASAAGPNTFTTRQSFMIRFDARTGGVSSNRDPALFVDPRPSTADRPGGERPPATQRWLRADRAENLAAWAQGMIEANPFDLNGRPLNPPYTQVNENARLSFIGVASNDTVLVKPVTRVAVYDERRMASAIGARRLNPETNSLYRPYDPASPGLIAIDTSLFPQSPSEDEIRTRINRWVEGDTTGENGVPDGTIDDADVPEARLFLLQPVTGELAEVLR